MCYPPSSAQPPPHIWHCDVGYECRQTVYSVFCHTICRYAMVDNTNIKLFKVISGELVGQAILAGTECCVKNCLVDGCIEYFILYRIYFVCIVSFFSSVRLSV